MKLTLSMKSTLRRWPALSLATGLMGLCLALPDRGMAQSGATAAITVATLKGTYIYAFTGYTVGSSGNLIAFAVAGRETFFGNGTRAAFQPPPRVKRSRAGSPIRAPTR